MLDFVDSSSICRSEFCDREDIHAPHYVKPCKEIAPRSCRAPWKLPAPIALDDAIVRAVSDIQPKNFAVLVDDVENDFGSLGDNRKSGMRRLHRRLRALCEAGRVLKIDVGGTLFAYLKPTSRVSRDVSFLRDQLRDIINYQGYEAA